MNISADLQRELTRGFSDHQQVGPVVPFAPSDLGQLLRLKHKIDRAYGVMVHHDDFIPWMGRTAKRRRRRHAKLFHRRERFLSAWHQRRRTLIEKLSR